jgi:hypothetical protein
MERRAGIDDRARTRAAAGVYAEGMPARGTPRLFSTPFDVEAEIAKHPTAIPPRDGRTPPKPKDWSHIPLLVTEGADYELCEEGKVELYGVEWPDTQLLNTLAAKRGWRDRLKYRNARERSVLEIIAAEQERVAYAFYGAAHRWSDDIDRWNADHPDHLFSLMEITTDWLNAQEKAIPRDELAGTH